MKPYIQQTLSDDKGTVASAQRIPPKSEGGGNPHAVLYTAQTLSAAQQAQARENIGAVSAGENELFLVQFTRRSSLSWSADRSYQEISAAYKAGKFIVFSYGTSAAFAGLSQDGAAFHADVLVDNKVYSLNVVENGGAEGNVHSPTTAASVVVAVSQMNSNQKLAMLNSLELTAETTVTVSSTTPTITPEANTLYNCGTLTRLTITDPPASGAYSIVFTSGATPTVTTIPATILGLENFAAEANTLYEINVLDNRAVVGAWEVTE